MDSNEKTMPVTQVSGSSSSSTATAAAAASAAESDSTEDKELQQQMEHWRHRLTALKNNENFEDKEASKLFRDMRKLARSEASPRKTKLISSLVECNFVELIRKMWKQCLRPELLDQDEDLPNHILTSLGAVWAMSHNVDAVCECVVQTGLYADMLSNLAWDSLTAEILNEPRSGAKRDFVEAHIATLHNVVRKTEAARSAFRQHHALDVVHKFRACSEFPMIAGLTLMMQCHLITEKDNKTFSADNEVFQWLAFVLNCSVAGKLFHGLEFDAIEVIEAVNALAVIDDNKRKLVESGALVADYIQLLSPKRKETLQAKAAHGLWLLAFNCKDAIIKQQPGCVEALKNLEKSTQSEKVRLKAAGALWLLENGNQQQNGPASSITEEKSDGVVYVSYNRASKSTVLQIRDRLKDTVTVSVDVEDTTGLSLESMADTVRQASVVLVCLSERYKDSPYCRTEAEYAASQQKPILSLLLEAGYKPDGWLSCLCPNGDSFYDFSQAQIFDDEWRKLHDKLTQMKLTASSSDNAANDADEAAAAVAVANTASHDSTPNINNWKAADVGNWLLSNNLEHLQTWFKDYDGSLLLELASMQVKSPDAVYNALIKENFSLTDVVKLNRAMKQLQA